MEFKEKSLCRINTPTKLLGLKSLEAMLLGALLCCSVFSLWLLIIIIPAIFLIIKKLHSAHKSGCPDFMSEFLNQLNSKSAFMDKNNVMAKL